MVVTIAHVYKRAKEANIAKVIVAAGNVRLKRYYIW